MIPTIIHMMTAHHKVGITRQGDVYTAPVPDNPSPPPPPSPAACPEDKMLNERAKWAGQLNNRHIVTEVIRHFPMPKNVTLELQQQGTMHKSSLEGGSFSYVIIRFPEWTEQQSFHAFMWMNPNATDDLLHKIEQAKFCHISLEAQLVQCMAVPIDYPSRGIAFLVFKNFVPYNPETEELPEWLNIELISIHLAAIKCDPNAILITS